MAGSNVLAAVSAAPKLLYSGQLADALDHVLYMVPAGGSAVLKHVVVCNQSGAAATISIFVGAEWRDR